MLLGDGPSHVNDALHFMFMTNFNVFFFVTTAKHS